jgi:hypothetical protein
MSMTTRVEQVGQCEVGTLTHKGREFSALGASVNGRHVTGYADADKSTNGRTRGDVVAVGPLHRWAGVQVTRTGWVVESYRCNEFGDTSAAVVFPVGRGRFIAGYLLVDGGSLFRGELQPAGTSRDDASYAAREESRIWIERDADDAEQDRLEQEADAAAQEAEAWERDCDA